MALFKILRGESSAFTTDLQSINIYPEFHDGYCYFIADTGLFYIDYDDGSETRLVPFSGEDVGYLLTEGKAYYLRRDNGTYIRYTGDYNLLVEYDSPDSMPYFYYKTDGKHRIPLNAAQAMAVKEINKGLDQKFWRGTKEEYKALDVKDEDTMYIVIDEEGGSIKADWNQNDESAPDYIKNRTHWVESEAHWTSIDSTGTTFIGETITVPGMNGISQFSGMYQLSNCNKYRVTVNGAEYIAEAYYETKYGYYMLYPGSLFIQLSESEVYMHRTDSKNSSDMSIKIEAYIEGAYHPLDAKFLPDTVATKPSMTRITLSTSGWDNTTLTQSVSIPGISADETAQLIQCAPTGASMIVAANSGIYCSGQAADTLTFKCTSIPTENVQFIVSWQDCVWIEPVVVTPTMINFTFNDYMSFEVENGTTWQEFIANDNTFYIEEDGSVIYPGSDCYVVYNGINVKASDVIVAGNYEYGDMVPLEGLV